MKKSHLRMMSFRCEPARLPQLGQEHGRADRRLPGTGAGAA